MKILVLHGNIISMAEGRPQCELEQDIIIEKGIITGIGSVKDFDTSGARVIDASNRYIMPGLINTHAHLGMSIFRETIDGYGLQDWLQTKIWPMEAKLKANDVYAASLLSMLEMIKTGTTTVNDQYWFETHAMKAAGEIGVRLIPAKVLMNIPRDGEELLSEFPKLLKKYPSLTVGLHGLYTSDEQYIKKCTEFAREHQLPIHMHYLENSAEIKDIETLHQTKPINLIKKYFKDTNTILVHCVKVNDEDINTIAQMGINVAHCPISNLRLGCGIAPIKAMMDAGINITLGTDGQGSGSNLDLFEAMKYTALLQKGINENPTLVSAYEVLKMATINGAKALGLADEIGSIEVGKRADLIIINPDITMQPANNIVANLVYNAKGSNVETTIINGRIIMEKRRFRVGDERNIIQGCQNIIKRIKLK